MFRGEDKADLTRRPTNYRLISERKTAWEMSGLLEHRMGFEPMNTGFADQRVSHFAIGAHRCQLNLQARHTLSGLPAFSAESSKISKPGCLFSSYLLLITL